MHHHQEDAPGVHKHCGIQSKGKKNASHAMGAGRRPADFVGAPISCLELEARQMPYFLRVSAKIVLCATMGSRFAKRVLELDKYFLGAGL